MSRHFFPGLEASAGRQSWVGLSGSSSSLALAELLNNPPPRTIIVVPNEARVDEVIESTEFFLKLSPPKRRVCLLPYPSRPADLRPSFIEEPHITAQRINVLHTVLESSDPVCVVTSFAAVAQQTISKPQLLAQTGIIAPGMEMSREGWVEQLVTAGYEMETLVEEPGDFAVRGAILDFFPPSSPFPIRAEFVGEMIESLRTFDPSTQRSLESIEEAASVPCREILLAPEQLESARQRLKTLADSKDLPPSARHALEDAILERRYLPAMNALLPIFSRETGSLFEYVGEQSLWVMIDPFDTERERNQLAQDFERVAQQLVKERTLAFPPSELSLPLSDVDEKLARRVTITLSDIEIHSGDLPEPKKVSISLHSELRSTLIANRKSETPLSPLIRAMDDWKNAGLQIVFLAASDSGAHRLQSILAQHSRRTPHIEEPAPDVLQTDRTAPVIVHGKLHAGFRFDAGRVVFVTEEDLFGERKHAAVTEVSREEALSSISELNPGDPVVHIDHGVGIYRGMERLTVQGVQNDFVHLDYAGGDKLYLPIYRLNRIHKYIGADGCKPQVDRLGNQAAWARTREKADQAIAEMAQELIQLYAMRKVAKGHALSRPDESYLSFEADFPFDETRDQLRTLNEVSSDLEAEKPMDRLVCGDVGFGKTEIALRAAFRVAMEGRQVAVLVPTTILAQQHYENFAARLSSYPIKVDFLSRFKSTTEQKKVVTALKEGTLDLVVGTHRLLSKDVAFKNLGLLIIDEEHRFGVRHKEEIKKFRNQIDVLTLTATPIPRTLQLSMAGIRDLSVINTPPLDRKAIQTYLCKAEDPLIRSVILKELTRKGQVFFVHNRVETIHAMQMHLRKLVPEARIEVGHGQMSERALEETMHRLLRKEFDVLLCTTIIESGLDIPSANTIIVNRADTFGLAQLYQLRGRVGRSDREAYAYLLIPGEEIISRDALKRLKVLKRFTELGSGLKIALHDLEIRGAGNLLGKSQSGHISAVGFELYINLLEREVRKLKGEAVKEEVEPEIQCNLPAYLPDEYVRDPHERLLIYKRFSGARDLAELEQLRTEFLDRFGPVPPTVENLFRIVDLKIAARQIGVSILRISGAAPMIEFADQAPINMNRLLAMVRKDNRVKLRPDNKLIVELSGDADTLEEVKKILLALAER